MTSLDTLTDATPPTPTRNRSQELMPVWRALWPLAAIGALAALASAAILGSALALGQAAFDVVSAWLGSS